MISVVIPVFGCNECIRELVSGVMKFLPSDKDFAVVIQLLHEDILKLCQSLLF